MKELQHDTTEGLVRARMKGKRIPRSHGLLGFALLCLLFSSCFSNSSGSTQVQFRLANGSSVSEGELSLVKVRLYGEDDRFPFAYATDAAKVCSQKPEDLETDSPLYEAEFDYNAHSARILATLPDGKINIVLELYRKQVNPDKSEEMILVARGTRSGVPVALSGSTDVGDIKFVDVLDSVRPTGVTLLGRTKKVDVTLKATPAALDYIVCYGTSASATTESAVLTQPSGTIDTLGGEPLKDDTQYFLRVFARNEGSLSLPAVRPGTAPVDPKTAPAESDTAFTATTTQQVSPTVQTEVSTGKAILSWDAVTGATGYCIDSPCFEPTNTTCATDPAKAVASPTTSAKLTDAEAQRLCKTGSAASRRCYTVNDIVSGRDCTFNIHAIGPDNGLGDPQPVTFRSLAPPKFIDARARSNSITLNWSASEGADDYVVLVNNGRSGEPYDCKINDFKGKLSASVSETVLVPPTAVCKTTQTVTPGKTYYISLQAKALGTNVSSPSSEVFVTPLAPLTTTLAKAGTGKIRVMWNSATDAAGYLVYYTTSATDTLFAGSGLLEGASPICVEKEKGRTECKNRPKGKESKLVPTTVSESVAGKSVSLNMIELTGASNGTPYYVTVTSFSNDPKADSDIAEPEKELLDEAESDPAPKLSVTPLAAPSGVKVSAGDANVRVAWSQVTGADGYCVQSDCVPGAPKCADALTQSLANEISETDAKTCPADSSGLRCFELKNVTNGSSCGFQVFALHGAADLSDPSAALPGVPVATPKDVVADGGTGQAVLTWPVAILGAQGVEVQYDRDQGVPYQSKLSFSGVGLKQAAITGLTNGVQYWFVVKGTNTSNGTSPASAEVTTIPLAAPVLSIQSGTQSVTATWTAVTGATAYEVHYDIDNGQEPFTGAGSAAGSSPVSKTDALAQAACPTGSAATLRCAPLTGLTNGQTYYLAVKAAHSTLRSLSVLSNSKSTQPVPAPTNVRINALSDVTNSSVQLSWDAVTGATGYNVYYDTDPLKPPLKQGTKLTPTGAVTTTLIPSLTSNTAYYFSVAAVNADGGSDASAAYLVATRLDTPAGVKVRGGSGRAAVSWTPVTGGGNYRVYWDPTAGKVSTGTSIKPAVLSTCALPADALCPGGTSGCCGIVCGDAPSGCAAPNLTNGAATYFAVRAEKAACATVPPVDTTNNCSAYATCSTASGTCAPPEFKATPLNRPTDFKVPTSGTVVTSSRIDTSWISPGGTFAGYKLYYDTDVPGAPYTGTGASQGFSPTLLANSLTTLQLTGLTSNLTYFLSLTAYSGDPNNPDAESDPRRTTLAANAAAGDLVLSVDSVDGFDLPNPIRLRIESEYIECTGLNAAATPDQFTPCTRGMYGTTAAAHAIGTVVYGDLMQATLIPAPATATLVLGTGQAKLTWTAVAGAGKYELYCGSLLEGTGADVPYDNVLTGCNNVETAAAFQVSSGTLTKTFTGLTNGSTPTPINPYRFAVRAKTDPNPATCAPGPPTSPTYYALTSTNNCGDLTSLTDPLLSGVPLTAPVPTATTQNGNQVNAGWSAVPQADGYRIYYWSGGSPNCATPAVPSCPSPGADCGPFSVSGTPCSTKWSGTDATQGASPILVCGGGAGSLTLTGLTADRRYWVTATAVKYSGAGCTGTLMTESDTGGGGGVFVDTTIPAPTGVVATFNQGTNAIDGPNYKRDNKPHITLSWNAEASATSYKIYYDDAGSCPSGGAPTYGYTGTAPNLALNPNPATASPISYTPAVNSGTLTVTLTGAAYGTTYVLGVQTVTGASESSPSCTPPATVLTPVPPPTSISAASRRAAATLTLALTNSDTTLTVNSTTGFDVPTYLKIDSEEIYCTAAGATTFSTCTRGINGTTAAAHVVNTSVIGTTGGVVFNWASVPNSDGTILWYGSAPDNYTCTGPPDPSCKKAISISVLPAGNCKDPATGNDTGSPPTSTTPPVDLCSGAYTSASLGGFSSSYRYYYSLGSKTEDGTGDLSTEQTFLALTPGWGSPAMTAGGGGTISLIWQRSAMATDYEIHYDTTSRASDTNAATVPPLPRSDQSPYAGAAGLTPAAAAIVGFSWAANLNTTLSAAVTNSDTNIPVTSIGNAGTFGLPVTVGIESEKLSCPTVNVGASRFEGCTRGFGGTTAAAHSGGTIVSAGYCRDTNTTDNNAECQITGLVPGTIYYFAVRIVSQGGKSAFSEERQTLDAPTLKNPIPSTGQAKLEWSTVTGADQYKFGRSTVSGACNTDFGGVTCPSTTVVGASPTFPQTQTGLTNGTQYYFVVRAENASNGSVSPNSTERTAKPLAKPATAMSGSAGTAYVSVNWSAVAGSNNYTIGRAAGTTLATAATSGDTTLQVNSAAGFVAPLTFKIDTEEIRCTAVATAPTPDELQSCARAQNGTTAAAHSLGAYIVPTCRTWEYKIGAPDPPGPPADAAPSGCTPTTQAGTGKTFTPLTNGTVYGFWVRAEDTVNNGASDWDGEVLGRPVAQPSGITAAAGTGQVTLTWTTPTAGADNIQLTRYTGVACGTLDNVSTEADTSPLTVTGLTDSVSYSFTLTAKNTTGGTAGTSTVSSCVFGTALSAPTLTTNCVEPNICGKTGSVDITFTVPVAGADSYEICYQTTAGWSTGFTGTCAPAGTNVAGASPAMPRNLVSTNGQQRFWAVRAKNTTNNGQSAFSAELNATALAAPTGLTATIDGTVGNKAVKLSWTAPACVSPVGTACMDGFKLYYDNDVAADVVIADYAPIPPFATEGNSPVTLAGGALVNTTLTGLAAANVDYTFALAATAPNSRGNISGQASGQTPRYGERTTWPFVPGVLDKIASSPAALEFDGDAPWEIIIGGNNDIVYALNADKSNVASSWPYTTVPAGDVQSCAAIADIASTPAGAEVVISNDAGTIFVLKNDGTVASSTALSGAAGLSCPVIGDVDGDAGLEVVVLARNGAAVNLYRFDVTAAGALTGLAGSPTNFAGELIGAAPDRGVTPALAEIDAGCNGLEIIFGDGNGLLRVVCGSTGAAATNCAWPVDPDGGAASALNNSPAVATNVDADAFAEIIVGSENGKLFKIEGDTCAVTTLLTGLGAFRSSPALGNLDDATDPEVEIAVGNDNGNVYALDGDGTALANFPKAAGAAVQSSPAIANYDNAGNAEVFVGDSSGLLHGYRAGLGGELPGFPVFVSSGNAVISSPAVADLDSPVDGKLEIIVGSDDGKVHVFKIEDTAAYGTLAWPMFHKNARRTGN